MAAFGALTMTNKGIALQSKAQTGVLLQFTRIAVGDGNLGSTSILALNALINETKSLAITKLKTQTVGKYVVGAVLSNQTVTTGFYFREIGVFAQDPDLGEILYCYANCGGTAEYIPAGGGPDVIEKALDIITTVGNASSISAVINSSLVYATKTEFDASLHATTGHKHTGVTGDGPKLDPTASLTYVPVNKAGDTLTGYIILHADPTNGMHPATKQYVDAIKQGLDIKDSVRAATTANITLSGTQTIDAVALVAGDRVLVKNQTTASQNGIYVVAAGAWARAVDADTSAKVTSGMYTFIEEGTANGGNGFTLTTTGTITLGTTALTFTIFNGPTSVTAGTGLSKSGNVLSLASGVATPGTYRSVTVDTYGRVTLGTNPTTLSGYGITDAAPLASPALTGTPTVPTAAADTNTTQAASTAFVIGQAGTTSPAMDGVAAVGTSKKYARDDHVHPTDTSRAPLASPALTGTPTVPTAAADTNTTQAASTAFVIGQAGTATPLMDGSATAGTSKRYAPIDHIHPTDTSRAPLNNPSFTGTVTLPADPTQALHAVTKQYADALINGLANKAYVKAATTASISLTGTQTIDGIALVAGDRVLVKDQATGSQNGIYVVAAGAWARSTDADIAPAEVKPGLYVFVSQGTVNGDNGFTLITDDPITLGTTALTFVQSTGAGQIVAGTGIVKTGNSLAVDLNNTNTSTSTTQAATANAAKLAYDRGSQGITDAATAQSTANAAQTTANAAMPKAGGTFSGDTTMTKAGADSQYIIDSAATFSGWVWFKQGGTNKFRVGFNNSDGKLYTQRWNGSSWDTLQSVDGTAATFAQQAIAQANTAYTTAQMRNITLSTADPSGGSNGDVWIKYTP